MVGRPRKPDEQRRVRQISIGLTEREHALLHARAERVGMRPVDYGRARLLSGRVIVARNEVDHHLGPLFLAQLSRIGNNLNQIARRLHLTGQWVPPSLEAVIAEIRDLLRKAAS